MFSLKICLSSPMHKSVTSTHSHSFRLRTHPLTPTISYMPTSLFQILIHLTPHSLQPAYLSLTVIDSQKKYFFFQIPGRIGEILYRMRQTILPKYSPKFLSTFFQRPQSSVLKRKSFQPAFSLIIKSNQSNKPLPTDLFLIESAGGEGNNNKTENRTLRIKLFPPTIFHQITPDHLFQ